MHDFDEWHRLGKHWHAYVEQRVGNVPSTRADRLRRPPDHALSSPRAVAEWLYRMKRVYLPAEPVKLLGAGAGWGTVGDDRHLERDLFEDELVASYGDSIYLSFACEHDRLDLWVEAVTTEDCSEVLHQEQE